MPRGERGTISPLRSPASGSKRYRPQHHWVTRSFNQHLLDAHCVRPRATTTKQEERMIKRVNQ